MTLIAKKSGDHADCNALIDRCGAEIERLKALDRDLHDQAAAGWHHARAELAAILALRDLLPGAAAPEHPGEAYAVAVQILGRWRAAWELSQSLGVAGQAQWEELRAARARVAEDREGLKDILRDLDQEELGKIVRETWTDWAKEQPTPKVSWLVPWEGLSEPDREVDRRIGVQLFARGAMHAARDRDAAQARATEIEAAIRKHRAARGDDRCWMDDDELYAALGEALPPRPLPPPDKMLANCRRFVALRVRPGEAVAGGPEGRWVTAAEIEALVPVEVLRAHYLAGIECDHEGKRDRAACACSRVALPWCPTVGGARDSWIAHVLEIAAALGPERAGEKR